MRCNLEFGLKQITPPASEPITLAKAKSHLRVTFTDDDDDITAWIRAARAKFEHETGRQLITAGFRFTFDDFPRGGGPIYLPKAPLQQIDSFTYLDLSGDVVEMVEGVDYLVDSAREPGQLYLPSGVYWPLELRQANAIEIEFTAGYGDDPEDVDPLAIAALRLLIGKCYEHREDIITGTSVSELPDGASSIMTLLDIGDELVDYSHKL